MSILRLQVLHVFVSVINYSLALREIEQSIEQKKRTYVCVAAVHLIVECQKNKKLLSGVNRASLITPDGMPLVWLLWFFGYHNVERVYGPTLMLNLCAVAAERAYPVFLLGGHPGQSAQVASKLTSLAPTLNIVGAYDTPIRPIPVEQSFHIREMINKAKPAIVFVGLGCPWQEQWMIDNRKYINAPVLIGVGAAFDFMSGRVRQAPEWIQQIGLEWLFRLLQEPRRLAYRYTIVNITFVYLLLKHVLFKIIQNTK